MAQKQFKPAEPVKTATTRSGARASEPKQAAHFIFDKGNYRLFIISFAVVVIGFILMSGTTDIYSTTKIVIAPLVVLAGFTLGFFAIFKKPSKVNSPE